MGAMWMRARAQIRNRRRATLGLALIMGLAGGVAMALEAGARRTDSSYGRFVQTHSAADAFVPNFPEPRSRTMPGDRVAHLPEVDAVARVKVMYLPVGISDSDPDAGEVLLGFAAADTDYGSSIDRPRVIRGRLADPDRLEEVTIGFAAAERLGLDVGDTVPLIDFGGPVAGVPPTDLLVVGVVAAPGEFPPQSTQGALGIHLTPAFYRERARALNINTAAGPDAVLVRLRDGASLTAFTRSLEANAGGPMRVEDRRAQADDVSRSIHIQALALRALAAFLGATVVLVIGHALAREAMLGARDTQPLRALGLGPRTAIGAEVLQGVLRTGLGLAGAVAVSVALSPLFPRGLARIAEPSPGVHIDVRLILLVVAVVVAVAVAATALPTRRLFQRGADERPRGPSLLADLLLRAGSSPAMVIGVRSTFHRGSGPDAVPMRTSLMMASLGIAAIVGVAMFGASASRLTGDPSLYGVGWDMLLAKDERPTLGDPEGLRFLRSHPSIADASVGEESIPIQVEGKDILALTYVVVKGEGVLPVVTSGRAPLTQSEILLGVRTMRELGIGVGDVVDVVRAEGPRRMTVVGAGITPANLSPGASSRPSEGAAMLGPADLNAAAQDGASAFVRLAPGADRDEVLRSLIATLGQGYEGLTPAPIEIANFGELEELPAFITAVIAVLVAATTGHVVTTTTRRRRRDMALLQTLGFRTRDLRATVLYHGGTFFVTALVIGIPLGIALGRVIWNSIAEEAGVLPSPAIPGASIAALGPAGSLTVLLACLVPAGRAARRSPAAALRVER